MTPKDIKLGLVSAIMLLMLIQIGCRDTSPHDAVTNTPQDTVAITSWPTQQDLQESVAYFPNFSLPPVSEMFGTDPNIILETWINPKDNGHKRGSTIASVQFLRNYSSRSYKTVYDDPYLAAKQIPYYNKGLTQAAEAWRKMVPHAPAQSNAGKMNCPFGAHKYTGLSYSPLDTNPIQTKCCRETVYISEQEMPEAYPARPNYSEEVILANGTTRTFNYFIPKGKESDRSLWFQPEKELAAVQSEQLFKSLPTLILAVVGNQDETAAACLREIFKQIPSALQEQPWCYDSAENGLAQRQHFTTKAVKQNNNVTYLSGKESEEVLNFYQSADLQHERNQKFPVWRLFRNDLNRMALLAEAYGAIYSQLTPEERAETSSALRDLFAFIRHTKMKGGNFTLYTLPQCVSIAIASQDQELFNYVSDVYFWYLVNHYYDDGGSVEGSASYANMVSWLISPPIAERIGREAFEEFCRRRPLVKHMQDLGPYPIRTLWGIENQSGDTHTGFFKSHDLRFYDEPNYRGTEESILLASRGEVCLRSGEPGSRMESILDFHDTSFHSQFIQLNAQLFYEGISLMPDLGYATKEQIRKQSDIDIQSPFEIRPKRAAYQNSPEAHNTATINGHQGNSPPSKVIAYSDQDGSVKAIQVELPADNFDNFEGDINLFDRQWFNIELPNKRMVAVSAFRLEGGERHDLFWNFASNEHESSLGKGTKQPEKTLLEYLNNHATPKPGAESEKIVRTAWFKAVASKTNKIYKQMIGEDAEQVDPLKFGLDSEAVTEPRTWALAPKQDWHMDFTIKPEKYINDRPVESFLKDSVHLRMWSSMNGTPAEESYIAGRAPFTGISERYGLICYQDSLEHITQHRQKSSEIPLKTIYLNVIEPYKEAQGPALSNIEFISDDMAPDSHKKQAIMFTDSQKNKSVLITNLESSSFANKEIGISGKFRFAYCAPKQWEMSLYDGDRFSVNGLDLALAPSLQLPLKGIEGDITGAPQHSALFVKSDHNLAQGNALADKTILIQHRSSANHQSTYQVKEVTVAGNDLYRIDLKNSPPFILASMKVEGISKNPNTVQAQEAQRFNPQGTDALKRLIYFPESDFKTEQTGAAWKGSGGWSTHGIILKDPIPNTVSNGDPFIIYSIQPDDLVQIPNHFSCYRKGDTFIINTSSHAKLTLPGLHHFEVNSEISTEHSENNTTLTIQPGKHALNIRLEE
jgi:hypothetical protein